LKVVLDSNVVLAALGTRGLCEAVFAACILNHEVVTSEPLLAEVAEHLASKFKMPARMVRSHVRTLREQCIVVEPANVPPDACRDGDDLIVLGTALSGRAECIVTGDHDLLSLGSFQHITILSPRAFYERLRSV
jgi:putative PIN family toxin of toxin-antitoxin system